MTIWLIQSSSFLFLKSYHRKCDRRVWWELMIKRLLLSSRCSVSSLWPNQPLLLNFNLHCWDYFECVVILKGSGVECVAVAREVRKMKKRSWVNILVLSQAKTTTHYLYLVIIRSSLGWIVRCFRPCQHQFCSQLHPSPSNDDLHIDWRQWHWRKLNCVDNRRVLFATSLQKTVKDPIWLPTLVASISRMEGERNNSYFEVKSSKIQLTANP